ncbi:MAG: acetyl-CoA acetyltransferase [Acidimicrobiales bacterium]
MIDEHQPVIIATGQVIERDEIVSPVELMARAAETCMAELPGLRRRIQHLSVVNVLTGAGSAPGSDLARLLGIQPARVETTAVGGNAPQWLVSRLADSIWSGDLEVALIAGGEAQRSAWAANRSAEPSRRARWRDKGLGDEGVDADPVVGDERLGFGQAELGAGLLAPVHVYPLFESVIAQKAGRTFDEQREFLGRLLAPMTDVATANDCAWFQVERSPAEISGPSVNNRLVSEPYSKRMCAFLGVDQAASVLMCSYGVAKAAGLTDRCVFCCSGADTADVWFPSARPDPGSSPGMAVAGRAALAAASLGIDDVRWLDFYSCFPCVLEMACEAFGLDPFDSRGLTVTGGLPYFGGPGNAYTLFAIATMTEVLRSKAGDHEVGLVSGIGWYSTKHSVGVYASAPDEESGWARADTDHDQMQIDGSELPVAHEVPEPGMPATVDASSVQYDGSGEVTGAPVIATLDDGRRVAAAPAESVELTQLEGRNLVGERVHVAGSPPRYVPS